MRLSVCLLLSSSLLLAGCGGSSHPAPANQYDIKLSIASKNNANDNSLSYGGDAIATIAITGGSTSDAGYPKNIQFIDTNNQTITIDSNNCLKNSNHQKTCQFTIRNVFAGPSAGTPAVDNFHLQATANNVTIQSNSTPMTLIGHESLSSSVFYLKNITTAADSFGKGGMHHNNLQYQLLLTLTNPAKALAPAATTTFANASLVIPANTKVGLLDSQCTSTSCTFTIQNQNTTTNTLQDVAASLSATAKVTDAPSGQAASASNILSLALPSLQSCDLPQANSLDTKGISLNSGKLPVYNSGQPLTKSGYTTTAMKALYPVDMNTVTLTGHQFPLTINKVPHLFSDQANDHIPTTPPYTSGYLEFNTCAEANDAYNTFHGASSGFVDPLTIGSATQKCYDDKQTRFIYYAIPKGNPPSKNGWPVIIMLHGSSAQTASYYLNPQDFVNKQNLPGTATANVFNNNWNWQQWETNPVNPTAGGSARFYGYSYYVRMRLLQTFISRGFAVISVTTWNSGAYDWWNFEPSYSDPWPYTTSTWPLPKVYNPKLTDVNSVITYFEMSYWPGMDQQFFEKLMSYMHNPSAYDTSAGDLKFDTSNLFLMGYSAGANMVSRLLNEFPSMQYTDSEGQLKPFPKVKGAIMLSGGSYGCYLDATHNVCPANALEERYSDSQSIADHPPTLVAQSLNDDNAGTVTPDRTELAGSVYYQGYLHFCPKGSSCQPKDGGTDGAFNAIYQPDNLIQIVHTNNEIIHHYFFPEMVIPSMNLLLNNTCVAKVQS